MSNTNIKKIKTPWPTKEAMVQVYQKKLWGKNNSKFYSGTGSHLPHIINPYIEAVSFFLSSFKTPITVCDLGCGDFNIGRHLARYAKKYIAVDIVPALIAHNKATFIAKNLEFQCLDISIDTLPTGDCVIIRQVLQHLSNAEILQIVTKLSNYKYVIITEHLPQGNFVPNAAIISGQGIRLKKQSGVTIVAPPFNFKAKKERQLSTILLNDTNGMIQTTLYEVF